MKLQLLKHQQRHYVTTTRGRAFITAFHEIQAILGDDATPSGSRLRINFQRNDFTRARDEKAS